MLERFALVLIVAAAIATATYILRLWHMRRMQPGVAGEQPALLYFRSDTCAVCPAQGRFVDQVATRLEGRLRVQRVDAEQEPEIAARYRVFTLPTTVLIDSLGQVRQVNYGLTDDHKLGRQLAALLEQPSAAGSLSQPGRAIGGRRTAVGRQRSF